MTDKKTGPDKDLDDINNTNDHESSDTNPNSINDSAMEAEFKATVNSIHKPENSELKMTPHQELRVGVKQIPTKNNKTLIIVLAAAGIILLLGTGVIALGFLGYFPITDVAHQDSSGFSLRNLFDLKNRLNDDSSISNDVNGVYNSDLPDMDSPDNNNLPLDRDSNDNQGSPDGPNGPDDTRNQNGNTNGNENNTENRPPQDQNPPATKPKDNPDTTKLHDSVHNELFKKVKEELGSDDFKLLPLSDIGTPDDFQNKYGDADVFVYKLEIKDSHTVEAYFGEPFSDFISIVVFKWKDNNWKYDSARRLE